MKVSVVVVSFMIIIVLAAPLVAVIAMLIWWRKNRAATFPACGKCGYDVSGSVGSVTRCPECGSEFTEAGIVPPRRRSVRIAFWVTAAVIVLLVSFIGFTMTYAGYRSAVAQRQRALAQSAAAQQAAAQSTTSKAPSDGESPEAETTPTSP